MRLFIGIKISKNTASYLSLLQKKIQVKYDAIKWAKPEKLHITLKFMGNFDSKNLPQLIKSLNTVTFRTFTLNLNKVDVFPNIFHPRILWIGSKSNNHIQTLKKNIDSKLFELKDENYVPHITLGRISTKSSSFNLDQSLIDLSQINHSICINQFHLIESILSDKGSRYKTIESIISSKF